MNHFRKAASLLLLLILLPGIPIALAQDVLYLTDDSKLLCKVVDIEDQKIKFKNLALPDGPDYSVAKSKVLVAFLQNGHYFVMNEKAFNNNSASFKQAVTEGNRSFDIIITNDNEAQAVQITGKEAETLKYKKAENADGPSYSVSLNKLAAIIYKNGTHEIIGSPTNSVKALLETSQRVSNLLKSKDLHNDTPAKNDNSTKSIIAPVRTGNEPTPPPTRATEEASSFKSASKEEKPRTEERASTSATDTPPAASGSTLTLTEAEIQNFQRVALDKTDQLGVYLSIIAGKSTPWEESNKAIDQACGLFLDEDRTVEVTMSKQSEKQRHKIRVYLKRVKSLKYDKVEVDWSDIVFVSDLRKGTDGNYYGVVSLQQTFKGYKDGKAIYEDVTKKSVEVVLKTYYKPIDGLVKQFWDVFLSDIGVEVTSI